MEDELRKERALRLDSPVARSAWHYEGVGLARSLSQIRPLHIAVILLAGFTIWGYACIGPAGRLLPGRTEQHRTDFTVFTEAGAAFFDGRNPYGVANPRGWHYLYPPLFALLVSPLANFDTESQVVFWYAINVALAFACFGEARRLLLLLGGSEPRNFFVVLVICAFLAVVLPFLECMQAGQLGIFLLYLLMLGSRLSVDGKSPSIWFLGGLTLALPASIKLVPALPVACLLFQRWLAVAFPGRSGRSWGRAITSTAGVSAGAFLFLLVFPGIVIGWHKNFHYLDVWQKQIVTNEHVGPQANFNIHSYRNQSLANAVYLFNKATTGGPAVQAAGTSSVQDEPGRIAHPFVRVAIGAFLAMLLAVVGIIGRRGNRLDAFTTFGLACCAILVVSPLSWGHYFVAELPALLCVPMWLSSRGMRRAARAAAVIPAVLSWTYYLLMPYAGGIGVLGLGTAVWFVFVCGSMLWAERSTARRVAAGSSRDESGHPVPSRPHGLFGTPSIGSGRHRLRPPGHRRRRAGRSRSQVP
jgi:hypothetical protein